MLQSRLFLHLHLLLYGKSPLKQILIDIIDVYFRISEKEIHVYITSVFIPFITLRISPFRSSMQFIQRKRMEFSNILL